jgi:hypothetical protein
MYVFSLNRSKELNVKLFLYLTKHNTLKTYPLLN